MVSTAVKIARMMAYFWAEHKVINQFARGKILDIGFTQRPNKLFRSEVVGLDLEIPRQKPENYSRMVRGDAHRLTKYFRRNEFDTVAASNLIEHLENPTEFMRQCNKVLKKGGLLIISTDNPYRWQTLIGNVFFPKGMMSNDQHIIYVEPRNLNRMAFRQKFSLVDIKCGEGLSFPFLQEKLIYVYRKTGDI